MRYLLDERTGSIKGKFKADWEFDLDNNIDYVAFEFEERRSLPAQPPGEEQLYTEFANIALPIYQPLFEKQWVPFKEFEGFMLPSEEEIFDSERLLDLAWKIGPLFGSYDDNVGLISESKIIEPLDSWFSAAKMLNLAIRAQAWLSDRSDMGLGDMIYFVCHAGRGDQEYWELVSLYPRNPGEVYGDFLELSEEEEHRLFLPATDKAFPDMTFLTEWEVEPPVGRRLSPLTVSLIPNGMKEPTIPLGYASFRYMTETRETAAIADALIAQTVRSLVLLHTHRIYHDLHDGFFGVAYGSQLERFWYNFGADAALGKLGVCLHCGQVFEAMQERKDSKVYCSTPCQENAKSARNYRKRKIRAAIDSECTNDVAYLLHYLDDYRISRKMVEDVLAEEKSE